MHNEMIKMLLKEKQILKLESKEFFLSFHHDFIIIIESAQGNLIFG
jgi:hypothetical protein